MEGEAGGPRCNVIYYSTSSQHDIAALFHNHTPPTLSAEEARDDKSLEQIYHNARTLLDADQGGFHAIYISSSRKQCLERLDDYANKTPTVVLVEVTDQTPRSISEQDDQPSDGTSFLRTLKTNIQGARYQKEVLVYALVLNLSASSTEALEAELTASLLKAGAEEVALSPLTSRSTNRLVGHIMQQTRPPARLVGTTMAQNLVNSIKETSTTHPPCHRPDQTLPQDRLKFVEEAVRKWAFPAHELDMDELTYAIVLMLEHVLRSEEMAEYRLDRVDVVSFVLATRRQYKHEREVYYHNWRHAVDVTQSIYQFLVLVGSCPPAHPEEAAKNTRSSVELLITPLDGLMLIVSAIGHDVGHPGVNNAFLVACNHPLAQLYNDKSVLENYHCAAYSQLLRRHWPALSKHPTFRQTLISNILATDMQRHFEYMGHLTEFRQKLTESDMSVEEWTEKDKLHAKELLTALMMKAADISNIARPFDISAAWAKILINEFASQGELESELDIPTCLFGGPPDKEDVLAAAQSQKGFMNLFGFPLFQGLSDIMPSISCSVDTLENNQRKWDERISAEQERRKTQDSGHATFASLGSKHETEVLKRHRQSEPTLVPTNASTPPTTPLRWQPGQHRTGSPARHPATDERKRLQTGFASREDGKRASAPSIGPGSLMIAPGNAASRRSSKDVALDQLHQLSLFAHQTMPPGSRRNSSDAAVQLSQSYPPSRRGSKDESLTTIVITSQGHNGRGTPPDKSSQGRSSGSPTKGSAPRQREAPRKQSGARSSHSHAASYGTTTTGHTHSPSTQPSSVAPIDDDEDASPTVQMLSTSPTTSDDPFVAPSSLSSLTESSLAQPISETTSTPQLLHGSGKGDSSPRIISRMTTEDSNDINGRSTPRKNDPGSLRESRSRSRLRSLRFWKKKKEPPGVDSGHEGVSP